LRVDVEQRFTVEQIKNHYWTLSDIPRTAQRRELVTYHHSTEQLKQNSQASSIGKVDEAAQDESELQEMLIPCETTMVPYLEEMYLAEIEQSIKNTGLVQDWVPGDLESEDPSSPTKSIKDWIKKVKKRSSK
jgi:hypothetical protein